MEIDGWPATNEVLERWESQRDYFGLGQVSSPFTVASTVDESKMLIKSMNSRNN